MKRHFYHVSLLSERKFSVRAAYGSDNLILILLVNGQYDRVRFSYSNNGILHVQCVDQVCDYASEYEIKFELSTFVVVDSKKSTFVEGWFAFK